MNGVRKNYKQNVKGEVCIKVILKVLVIVLVIVIVITLKIIQTRMFQKSLKVLQPIKESLKVMKTQVLNQMHLNDSNKILVMLVVILSFMILVGKIANCVSIELLRSSLILPPFELLRCSLIFPPNIFYKN